MARSDNVVRVALTPKYRDVPLLCEILTYHMGAPPIVKPIQEDSVCRRFTPPIEDFELDDMRIPAGTEYIPSVLSVPAIYIVLEGEGAGTDGVRQTVLRPGVVVFVAAKSVVTFNAKAGSPMRIVRTHTNVHLDEAASSNGLQSAVAAPFA